jgi:prepilin-type processing-associated H-X9-DG protein
MTKHSSSRAFTLIELLALIAVIIMLAVLMLPAIASSKVRSQLAACLNNQKQFAAAWQSYGNDNGDALVGMSDHGSALLPPDWTWRPGSTGYTNDPNFAPSSTVDACRYSDQWGYRISVLARYAPNLSVIHCPGDGRINSAVPAYRSYSGAGGLHDLSKTTSVLHPAARFLWMEENDPRLISPLTIHAHSYQFSENIGSWDITPNPNGPTPPGFSDLTTWYDAPGVFHGNQTTFSWADGHVSTHVWLSTYTLSFAKDPSGGRAGAYDSLKNGSAPTALWFQDLNFTANAYATWQWP